MKRKTQLIVMYHTYMVLAILTGIVSLFGIIDLIHLGPKYGIMAGTFACITFVTVSVGLFRGAMACRDKIVTSWMI